MAWPIYCNWFFLFISFSNPRLSQVFLCYSYNGHNFRLTACFSFKGPVFTPVRPHILLSISRISRSKGCTYNFQCLRATLFQVWHSISSGNKFLTFSTLSLFYSFTCYRTLAQFIVIFFVSFQASFVWICYIASLTCEDYSLRSTDFFQCFC